MRATRIQGERLALGEGLGKEVGVQGLALGKLELGLCKGWGQES